MNRKTNEQLESAARTFSTSPVPLIQSTRRKSRGEQINFRLASSTTTTTGPQKRKKDWRSPSNPIDFMNCVIREQERLKEYYNTKNNSDTDNMRSLQPTTAPSTLKKQHPQHHQQQLKQQQQQQQQLSLKNSELSKEMTIVKTSSRRPSQSKSLIPYEALLLRGPDESKKFVMLAELSVSPMVSTGSSDYTSTRRHVFAFQAAYCRADLSTTTDSFDSTSLAHGHIDPLKSDEIFHTETPNIPVNLSTTKRRKAVTFSRCSLVQVILRNPEDNSVAGIFVVKLDLTDMPPDSRTILRQKVYKSKCLTDTDGGLGKEDVSPDYLAKFIEIPLKRTYDAESNRQKIILAGPLRVAFSFNRSNLRFTSPRRSDATAVEPVQKTRTLLQFPSIHQKYFPIHHNITQNDHDDNRPRSNSLNNDNTTRSFQHGSLCL